MYSVNDDMSIYVTRGDYVLLGLTAQNDDGSQYTFQPGDVIEFKVTEKKACENVVLYKKFDVEKAAEVVEIFLDEKATKIGDVISKPVDYWYEVELGPNKRTLIGYDEESGAKIFRLFPEGDDVESTPVEPGEIPAVDEELDVTSEKPVQNKAVAAEIFKINDKLGNLVAEDGTELRFGVNEKGEYGYIIKKDGADTVIPFKRAFGNAQPWQVLAPATFTNESGEEKTGTMKDNGTKSVSLKCGGQYTIPEGYHNGKGKVSANSLASQTGGTATAEKITKDYTAWVNGVKVTGTSTADVDYNAYKQAVVDGLMYSGLNVSADLTATELKEILLARFPDAISDKTAEWTLNGLNDDNNYINRGVNESTGKVTHVMNYHLQFGDLKDVYFETKGIPTETYIYMRLKGNFKVSENTQSANNKPYVEFKTAEGLVHRLDLPNYENNDFDKMYYFDFYTQNSNFVEIHVNDGAYQEMEGSFSVQLSNYFTAEWLEKSENKIVN